MNRPWQDEDTLRELYWDEGLSQSEIADRLDCRKTTISKWMRRLDIERRDGGPESRSLRNPDKIRSWYYDENLSINDIAERSDTSPATVHMWMEQYGIERRDRGDAISLKKRREIPYFGTTPEGYEKWQISVRADRHTVSVHRLVAAAEFGIEAVVDKVVHHANDIPWLNVARFDMSIPELEEPNLVPMERDEHSRQHRIEYLKNS